MRHVVSGPLTDAIRYGQPPLTPRATGRSAGAASAGARPVATPGTGGTSLTDNPG
jgi:hypothetical protein